MAYINGQSVLFAPSGTKVTVDGVTQPEWEASVCDVLSGEYYVNIDSGTDLNSLQYLEPKVYVCGGDATASSLSNSPVTMSFVMTVRSIANTKNDATADAWVYRIREIVTRTGQVWRQNCNSAGTAGSFTFGSWTKVATIGEINGLSMLPAHTNVSITVPSSGGTYTPPSNGWIEFSATASTGGYIEIGTYATNDLGIRTFAHSGGGLNVFLPVRAGKAVSFYYSNVSNTSAQFIASVTK